MLRAELLFLDEPTTGLDPRSRNQVWDIVRAIAGEGTTVLLTTQYLEEADRLADRLAVIDHGRLIAEGTSRELKESCGQRTLHVRVADRAQRAAAEAVLRQVLGGQIHDDGDSVALAARVSRAGTAHRCRRACSSASAIGGRTTFSAAWARVEKRRLRDDQGRVVCGPAGGRDVGGIAAEACPNL